MAAAKKKSTAKKPKSPPDVKVESFVQNLRVELSDDERLEHGARLAHLHSEKALKVEAAKAATAHLRSQIKEVEAEISRLSREVGDKATYKDVRCERRFVYRTGKVVEVRLDTNDETFERPMTLQERQVPLDLEKRKDAKEKLKEKVQKATGQEPEGAVAPEPPLTDEPPESSEDNDADEQDDLDEDDSETAAE